MDFCVGFESGEVSRYCVCVQGTCVSLEPVFQANFNFLPLPSRQSLLTHIYYTIIFILFYYVIISILTIAILLFFYYCLYRYLSISSVRRQSKQVRMTNHTEASKEDDKRRVKADRVSCMRVVQADLWISIGNVIVITAFHNVFLQPHHCLRLQGDLSVTEMCHHRDQVWCLCRQKGTIIEFDSGSYDVICYLECSKGRCHVHAAESAYMGVVKQVVDMTAKKANQSKAGCHENQGRCVSSYADSQTPQHKLLSCLKNPHKYLTISDPSSSLVSRQESRRTRRKLSMRARSNKDITDTPAAVAVVDSVVGDKEAPIRRLEHCNGVLWLTMDDGGMMLLNVMQDNSCNLAYGTAISTLKHYNLQEQRIGKKGLQASPSQSPSSLHDAVILDSIQDVVLSDVAVVGGGRKGLCDDVNEGEALVVSVVACKLKKLPHRRSQAFVWKALQISDIVTHQHVSRTVD